MDPVGDYVIDASDLQFLCIDIASIDRWRRRSAPLGLLDEEFEAFLASLDAALKRDELSYCDIRLQGSSARFFAGAHKRMPWDRDALHDAYVKSRKSGPTAEQLDWISQRLGRQWPHADRRPTSRPFDSLHIAKLEERPSDYDVQISSDEIAQRILEHLTQIGVSPTEARERNADYDFFHKYLVETVCTHLDAWAAKWSRVFLRDVSIACFDGKGPPDPTESGAVSSHFRDDDWILCTVDGIRRA